MQNPNIQVVVLDDAFKQPVDRLFLVSRLGSFEDETELIRLAKEVCFSFFPIFTYHNCLTVGWS